MSENRVKILSCYHKPTPRVDSPLLIPIHVGRKTAPLVTRWKMQGITGDDTGIHISEKNRNYAEMTALYWAWKNPDKIGRPERVGLAHYRRFLVPEGETRQMKWKEALGVLGQWYADEWEKTQGQACRWDLVLPAKVEQKSEGNLRTIFGKYHGEQGLKDLSTTEEIVKEKFPAVAPIFGASLEKDGGYYCNMFAMKWELFEEYCEFIFGVVQELEKRRDLTQYQGYQSRVIGFLSERLSNGFFQYLQQTRPGLKWQEWPWILVEL